MIAPLTDPHRSRVRPASPPGSQPGRTGATARRPDLRVVEAARPNRAGIYGAIVVLVIFGTLFLNAGFHTTLVSGQQRLDSLNDQVLEQEQRNQRLRLEVASLESPDRIVEAAQRDAMILPAEVHWLSPGPDAASAIVSTSERVAPTTTTPATTTPATTTPPAGTTPEAGDEVTAAAASPDKQAAPIDGAPVDDTPVATGTGDR